MAGSPLRCFLVRHGEVDANREMRYLGLRDDPWNDVGEAQARALAARFEDIQVDAVLSSPLRRTEATARRIADACGRPVELEPRLLEMGFGRWEGLTHEQVRSQGDVARRHLERWRADPGLAPPGGESLADVQVRVVSLVQELEERRPGRTVVLVTHVGPIKALLCHALGVPLARTARMFLDPGTLTVLDLAPSPVLRLFNDHGHLGWTSARWMSAGKKTPRS